MEVERAQPSAQVGPNELKSTSCSTCAPEDAAVHDKNAAVHDSPCAIRTSVETVCWTAQGGGIKGDDGGGVTTTTCSDGF